jgi:membrane protease YdiL (CAAX protease family)
MAAQGGVAEELLFRGFLFGGLARGRGFWRAALLSMPAFVAAHLYLFATMPTAVAIAALVLAILSAFPLAWLYVLGGGTIWAPALLHAVIQSVKIVDAPPERTATLGIAWMAVTALVPYAVFLARPGRAPRPAVTASRAPGP